MITGQLHFLQADLVINSAQVVIRHYEFRPSEQRQSREGKCKYDHQKYNRKSLHAGTVRGIYHTPDGKSGKGQEERNSQQTIAIPDKKEGGSEQYRNKKDIYY